MEILREAPKVSSFVPLIEHQSTTPASFYSGPPVLHYYSDRSKLVVLENEVQSIAALAPLLEHAQTQSQAQESESNGSSSDARAQKTIQDLDIYVTSDKLLLFSTTANTGFSIPYPSISLHAIQSLPQPSTTDQQGLYMQVISQPPSTADDDEPDSISLTIIPTASAPPQVSSTPSGTTETGLEEEDKTEQTPVQAMFNALSACSNLHPDPVEQGDEDDDPAGGQIRLFSAGLAIPGTSDGGLPPAMPGSGGWITAENMHEFVDENGNWIDRGEEMGDEEGEGEPLGPGAGTVRQRADEGGEHANGHDTAGGAGGDEADETKWRRTS